MTEWHRTSALLTRAPFSTIFTINPEVQRLITADMGANGYDESKPIDVWEMDDGTLVVIDGHTRLAAALSIGLTQVCTFHHRFIQEIDALAYAIHNQRDRRNLSGADLVRAIQIYDEMVRQPHGGDRNPYGRSGAQGIKGSTDPLIPSRRSADVVAAALGVSDSTVKRARRIYDDPEVMAKVDGGMSIYTAAEEFKRGDFGNKLPPQESPPLPRLDDEPWFRAKAHGGICEASVGAALAEVNRRIAMASADGLDIGSLIASDRRVGVAWRRALREANLLARTIRGVLREDISDDETVAA